MSPIGSPGFFFFSLSPEVHSQDAEFYLLDDLWNAIHDLGFTQVDLYSLCRLHDTGITKRSLSVCDGDAELSRWRKLELTVYAEARMGRICTRGID